MSASLIALGVLFVIGSFTGFGLEYVLDFLLGKNGTSMSAFGVPFLPIYGFGTIIIYIISASKLALPLKIGLFWLVPSILELLTGLFLLTFFKLRLWDYTKHPLNINGLISLPVSVIWFGLALTLHFWIFPWITKMF